jgi:hypothetical protein
MSVRKPHHFFIKLVQYYCILQTSFFIMPVIFRWDGYRFFFFSNEGNPREPCHIHIQKGEAIAKFWITPEIELAEAYKMTSSELKNY